MPRMLAMLISMLSPNACPYDSQLKNDTPSASIPIKPPSTIPVNINKNKAHEFLLPEPLIDTPPLIHFFHKLSSF